MKEYISRDAALETVREKLLICDALPDGISKDASVFTLASMQHSLEAIPAADVREVVLCRDCRYFEPFRPHDGFCKISGMLENNDFFCAHGDCPNCGAEMKGETDHV